MIRLNEVDIIEEDDNFRPLTKGELESVVLHLPEVKLEMFAESMFNPPYDFKTGRYPVKASNQFVTLRDVLKGFIKHNEKLNALSGGDYGDRVHFEGRRESISGRLDMTNFA